MEQLDKTALLLWGNGLLFHDLNHDEKLEIMRLTIATIQAKALADIAYMQGIKG